jgi:gamma-glutamyltranspeptidase / glutathione hydrolase
MNPQQAVEAPRVTSWNFPNSFSPHDYQPGRLDAEGRINRRTLEELVELGHRVGLASDWSPWASQVHAAIRNPATGVLLGASDPRASGAAIGW